MHMFFQFKDDNNETKERQEKEWVKCENPEAIKELELCVLPSLYELRKL